MRRHTFVTVAFEGDAELMALQARSMALYCDPRLVEEILVIDNFAGGAGEDWIEALRAAYGPHGPRMTVLPAPWIVRMPPDPTKQPPAGWWVQQALKLAVAKWIAAERYVVLDAKTHLTRPLLAEFLEAEDGRPRVNAYGYATHPLRDRLVNTCEYFGIDADDAVLRFTRTSTPFVMITAAARAVVGQIERRDGSLLETMAERRITEFFAYSAALHAAGALEALYDFGQPFCSDLWDWGAADDKEVLAAIGRARNGASGPFFSVHRRALALLTDTGARALAEFWTERALVADRDRGLQFIRAAAQA